MAMSRTSGRELSLSRYRLVTLTSSCICRRALVKNLFVQNAAFSAFIFSIHKNIAASPDAELATLLPASEARTLARLIGMSNDIQTLQVRLSPQSETNKPAS